MFEFKTLRLSLSEDDGQCLKNATVLLSLPPLRAAGRCGDQQPDGAAGRYQARRRMTAVHLPSDWTGFATQGNTVSVKRASTGIDDLYEFTP